jgi:Fe-S cluster biogenesis protein NfuA
LVNNTVIKIQEILATLQPAIVAHNGIIEFVKLEQDIVYVKLKGACVGCPSSFYTLTFGIEQALREQLPHIQGVMPVLD